MDRQRERERETDRGIERESVFLVIITMRKRKVIFFARVKIDYEKRQTGHKGLLRLERQ
jgi:hypothetical protein